MGPLHTFLGSAQIDRMYEVARTMADIRVMNEGDLPEAERNRYLQKVPGVVRYWRDDQADMYFMHDLELVPSLIVAMDG